MGLDAAALLRRRSHRLWTRIYGYLPFGDQGRRAILSSIDRASTPRLTPRQGATGAEGFYFSAPAAFPPPPGVLTSNSDDGSEEYCVDNGTCLSVIPLLQNATYDVDAARCSSAGARALYTLVPPARSL